MAEKDSMDRGSDGPRTNQAQDIHDQGIALVHVVDAYPTQLRLSDLGRELTDGSGDFAERDRIERAARDLVAVGLLFRCDGLLLPTRAALRFNEIVREGV